MFTCISCKAQTSDDERPEGRVRGTPKAATKSLTAQIKDMAVKVSSSLHLKPQTTGSSKRTSEEANKYPYMVDVSAPPTPGLNFGGLNQHAARPFGTRLVGSSSSTTTSNQTLRIYDDDDASSMTMSRGFTSFQTHRHESSSIRGYAGFQTTGATLSPSVSESKEWMAQIEEGIHMVFVSLPNGGNELVKIRFSLDMFNRWQAQRWWDINQDRIIGLYDVRRIHGQYLNTPPPTEHDEIEENPREAPCHTPEVTRDSPMSMSFKDWAQAGYQRDV
ncbi:hypothetical protein RIF29_16084 [Crotalaria pallida]|uniref:BRX domain-containing protein n=1 Tax=Crotalaria pallida TaxID=3830 RepID=A0AAN9FKB5_CROPI